ncbi:MAG TPA: YdcF family protein [Novosphingobium sp.]|nr:YdcF family protein [Novosphingobium sp.]HNN56684.1 YdcF family protein [Novosphingobium sp.]
MLRRLISIALLAWMGGFLVFAFDLPQPAHEQQTDAVVVLTGGAGRVDRGIKVLREGWAKRLLVSGVGREVKPHEFAAQYKVSSALMACCVTLGFEAVDTRSNAKETAGWIEAQEVKSVRLVTSDWHMRRAAMELRRTAPPGVAIIEDAVPTHPTLKVMFKEYHKLIARFLAGALGE